MLWKIELPQVLGRGYLKLTCFTFPAILYLKWFKIITSNLLVAYKLQINTDATLAPSVVGLGGLGILPTDISSEKVVEYTWNICQNVR